MRITSTGFNPYQTKLQQVKNSEAPKKESTAQANALQSSPAATYESTSKVQSSATESLTKEQKTENFTNFMLDRYKEYGLTLSSGPMPENLGVAPSFSVDPKILEQAANDPEKAKELDDLLYGLTTIGTNLFNAINNPPAVKFSMSVHVNADGSRTVITRKEYSSAEAKNKYGGFDFNSFLDKQEELLEKHQSDFDYNEAIGADKADQRRAEKGRIQEYRDEQRRMHDIAQDIIQNVKQDMMQETNSLTELQQDRFLDMKI
ncbi:hypothetical protein [Agathobaculum sp. Marseille-P7918]|uniref:hypothetical protein n=1 Tax=Agathobaculum sp. Marseille-P7918 TaxID=2479843 RepID=UPI0035679220